MSFSSFVNQDILVGTVVGAAVSFLFLYKVKKTINGCDSASSGSRSNSSVIGQPHPFVNAEADYEGCIYLDYNATTPVYAEVFEAMKPFLTCSFGNPASPHVYGKRCADAVSLARKQVGYMINAQDSDKEVIFMSCGTECDNRAIDIALHHYYQSRKPFYDNEEDIPLPVIVTSKIEHPAVICYLRVMEFRKKLKFVEIPVSADGFVDVKALTNAITVDTALVTIMHSNNEVGTIQPIKQISQIVTKFNLKHSTSILVHSDAAQSIGKVPIDVQAMACDMMTIVGHKFGAPKGVSALYVRSAIKVNGLMRYRTPHPLTSLYRCFCLFNAVL